MCNRFVYIFYWKLSFNIVGVWMQKCKNLTKNIWIVVQPFIVFPRVRIIYDWSNNNVRIILRKKSIPLFLHYNPLTCLTSVHLQISCPLFTPCWFCCDCCCLAVARLSILKLLVRYCWWHLVRSNLYTLAEIIAKIFSKWYDPFAQLGRGVTTHCL